MKKFQIIETGGVDIQVEGLSNVKSNINGTPPNDVNQTLQYPMEISLASENDSEHEGYEVSTSKSTSECSSKPIQQNYGGQQNKEDKPTKKSSKLSIESV